MKFTPRMKKLALVLVLFVAVVTLTGCMPPKDANGNIKLIETTTTFKSIMKDENWFSAIFVWPLSQTINHLTPKVGVGWAIMITTVVINAVLGLATLKSTIGAQQMQLIQPEMEKIQRKYEGRDDANSKNRQAMEIQQLYAKYNINPLSTILVTFLQFPIIIAMYLSVQRAYAVANGTFLGLNLKLSPLAGTMKGEFLFIGLFLFMALCQVGSMFLPQYYAKKKAERLAAKQHRKPEKIGGTQQKIMQIYMMVMILFLGLTWPAAMALYWAINSLVTIIKTVLVQKYIEKHFG